MSFLVKQMDCPLDYPVFPTPNKWKLKDDLRKTQGAPYNCTESEETRPHADCSTFFFFFFPSFPKFMLLRFIILQRHTAFQTIKLLKHATSFATRSRLIFFLAPHRTQLGVSSVINQIQVLHFFSASSLLTNQRTALVSSLAQGKSPLWQLLDVK